MTMSNTDEIQPILITIFQYLTDTISAKPKNLSLILEGIIEELSALKEKYPEYMIVRACEKIAGKDSLELHWLARAGYHSVSNLLIERLNVSDECQVMWAAVGLVYIDQELGLSMLYQIIESVKKGSGELTLDDIYDELQINNIEPLNKIEEYIEKIT